MLSILVPATAAAESAGSQSRSLQSGLIDAGDSHACAALVTQQLRCWGSISFGKLGIGLGEDDGELGIGDDELPTDIAPVDLGAGRSAREISIGAKTACVILDDGSVRCWGDNQSGQAGYGNSMVAGKGILGDTPDELPALLGPVDLGPGRTAKAISVGESHVCAILDTGDLRCWGQSNVGQLGLGTSYSGGVGDNETPGSVPLLDLGGKKALAITAGGVPHLRPAGRRQGLLLGRQLLHRRHRNRRRGRFLRPQQPPVDRGACGLRHAKRHRRCDLRQWGPHLRGLHRRHAALLGLGLLRRARLPR